MPNSIRTLRWECWHIISSLQLRLVVRVERPIQLAVPDLAETLLIFRQPYMKTLSCWVQTCMPGVRRWPMREQDALDRPLGLLKRLSLLRKKRCSALMVLGPRPEKLRRSAV